MIITIGKYDITIDTWNSLSWNQLLTFCRYSVRETNPYKLKVKLLMNFCGLQLIKKRIVTLKGANYQWFRFKGKSVLINLPVITLISERIISLFYRLADDGNYHIDTKLTRNIIPPFCIGIRKYIGPADGLTNITFKEFIHSETCYSKYLETGAEEYLDRIIAILFRPRKNRFVRLFTRFNGDNRIIFNDYTIDKKLKAISRIDPAVKLAIKYYYLGCRRLLMQLFPYVFSAGSGRSSGEDPDTFRMYMHLVDNLAGNNPAVKETIRNQFLYEVLDSMNNIGSDQEKLKNKK